MSIKICKITALAAVAISVASAAFEPARAQVAYQPFVPFVVAPFGYPVPSGVLQPNEELGTSPSYVVSTNPYAPGVGVVPRCQYPNGWNVTDFSRDVNGIPNGIEHTCPVAYAPPPTRLRARY